MIDEYEKTPKKYVGIFQIFADIFHVKKYVTSPVCLGVKLEEHSDGLADLVNEGLISKDSAGNHYLEEKGSNFLEYLIKIKEVKYEINFDIKTLVA
jgi:predicted transcriptional regulator